jgi:hypothetical protein
MLLIGYRSLFDDFYGRNEHGGRLVNCRFYLQDRARVLSTSVHTCFFVFLSNCMFCIRDLSALGLCDSIRNSLVLSQN